MMSEEAAAGFARQIHELWVGPELEKRQKAGTLPAGFHIAKVLIRMPQDAPPIVEFNEEIGWEAKVKVPDGREIRPGEPAYLHDVERIESVEPPKVGGVRVAFVYLFWNGTGHQIIFDFTPNTPAHLSRPDDHGWDLGRHIADSLQAVLTEHVVRIHDAVQSDLRKIGLWAAPSLLPYPLSKIAILLRRGDEAGARALLVSYCTPQRLASLAGKWWSSPQLQQRRRLLEEVLTAHASGQYCLTIATLLPQLEGTVTDWAYTKAADVPFRQESKTKKFRDLVSAGPPTTYTFQRIAESAIDFILSGPVLATFQKWFDSIDTSFANRHAVEHGKYDDSLYTEENSIKLLLLLDSIYHIIANC
jgi:hypothetical protein